MLKKSSKDAIKTASKSAIQKIAEANSDLLGNQIADKKTSVSKSPKESHLNELHIKLDEKETDIPKERYMSSEKENKLLMN